MWARATTEYAWELFGSEEENQRRRQRPEALCQQPRVVLRRAGSYTSRALVSFVNDYSVLCIIVHC